jgi:hypothetical protein
MEKLTALNLFSRVCHQEGKWGVYLTWNLLRDRSIEASIEELRKAMPYYDELTPQQQEDHCAFLLFDSEREMRSCFDRTVGSKGPTKMNPYNGPMKVYARVFKYLGTSDLSNFEKRV